MMTYNMLTHEISWQPEKQLQHEDTLLTRIDALIDGRDYTELELPVAGWQRWAYFAAKGEW